MNRLDIFITHIIIASWFNYFWRPMIKCTYIFKAQILASLRKVIDILLDLRLHFEIFLFLSFSFAEAADSLVLILLLFPCEIRKWLSSLTGDCHVGRIVWSSSSCTWILSKSKDWSDFAKHTFGLIILSLQFILHHACISIWHTHWVGHSPKLLLIFRTSWAHY